MPFACKRTFTSLPVINNCDSPTSSYFRFCISSIHLSDLSLTPRCHPIMRSKKGSNPIKAVRDHIICDDVIRVFSSMRSVGIIFEINTCCFRFQGKDGYFTVVNNGFCQ